MIEVNEGCGWRAGADQLHYIALAAAGTSAATQIVADARMDANKKKDWIDFLVVARKDFYNRWVKEDVHRALFASFEDEAQQLLDKYLDEVEASLDHREVTDPITSEARPADERFLRSDDEVLV